MPIFVTVDIATWNGYGWQWRLADLSPPQLNEFLKLSLPVDKPVPLLPDQAAW